MAEQRDFGELQTSQQDLTHALIEQKRSQHWVEILRNEGFGFIGGKFHPDWTINGKKIGLSYHDKGIWKPGDDVDFRAVGSFGKILGEQFYSSSPTIGFLSIIPLLPADRDYFRQANYYIAGPIPDTYWKKQIYQANKIGEGWSSSLYVMWGDKTRTPGGFRGNTHVEFDANLFLPTARSIELINEIKQKPVLIEDIFQGIFSGLTGENGLRRVSTDTLRVIQLGGIKDYTDYDTQRRLIKSPQELHFSHPVGEVSQ